MALEIDALMIPRENSRAMTGARPLLVVILVPCVLAAGCVDLSAASKRITGRVDLAWTTLATLDGAFHAAEGLAVAPGGGSPGKRASVEFDVPDGATLLVVGFLVTLEAAPSPVAVAHPAPQGEATLALEGPGISEERRITNTTRGELVMADPVPGRHSLSLVALGNGVHRIAVAAQSPAGA